ncbi:MAG: tetratricopeptide repeat protein, partial [candidate division KSB1 bacterium]|nr:tetratricopeptide repeat protein [candidate division KSB1 bacterium]
MRKALELERNDIALRKRLAELLARSGDRQEAASEYKLVANALMDSGRTAEAADALRRALEAAPNDVAAREKLFQLLAESGGKTVAIETGMELAGTYSSLGLGEKARAVLDKVLAMNPSDRLAVERKLIEAHLAVGDARAAIELHRKIARRFMKSRDYEEAAAEYQEILKLDSKDDEARKRLAEIQAGIVERVLERKRRILRTAIAISVAIPILIFVGRELASRPAENAAHAASLQAAMQASRSHQKGLIARERGLPAEAAETFSEAAGLFEEAARHIAEFRRRWCWTLASRSSAATLSE